MTTDPRGLTPGPGRASRGWLALALLPLLGGCLGAVALPLLAGGTLMVRDRQRVRAATPAPAQANAVRPKAEDAALASSTVVVTSLTELPPPSGAPQAAADDRWRRLFDYVEAFAQPANGAKPAPTSALLIQPPDIAEPRRQACSAPVPAIVIDLDDGAEAFAPDHLAPAPAEVAAGLARLRQAQVVVLWISRLPAARAADVAQALRTSGLDPQRQDQLLLVRNGEDRKQALRQDANRDVCVVAIAGDRRGDFDELYDYLRNPESAFALDSMIGDGWFLIPSLDAPASGAKQDSPAVPSTER